MTSTTNEFRVGDIVRYQGTVVAEDNGFIVEVEGPNGAYNRIHPENLVLVERPQPKISVELTREQFKNLAFLAETYGMATVTHEARTIILEALDASD